MGVEAGEAADLVGHEHLRGAVDGQGTETRRGAHRPVQRLGGPVAGRVHADTAAEEDADRLRSVAVDDGAQPGAEVVEARVPRRGLQGRGLQGVARPHQRMLEPVGVMVQSRQRPSLRAGVAVRERVVVVTADRTTSSPATSTRIPHTAVQIRQKLLTVRTSGSAGGAGTLTD